MRKESDVHETLDLFLSRYGIPEALVSDGAKAYSGGKFQRKAKEARCICKTTDPYDKLTQIVLVNWMIRINQDLRDNLLLT